MSALRREILRKQNVPSPTAPTWNPFLTYTNNYWYRGPLVQALRVTPTPEVEEEEENCDEINPPIRDED